MLFILWKQSSSECLSALTKEHTASFNTEWTKSLRTTRTLWYFVIPATYLGEQSLANSWQYASLHMTHTCRMNYCKSITDLRGLLAVFRQYEVTTPCTLGQGMTIHGTISFCQLGKWWDRGQQIKLPWCCHCPRTRGGFCLVQLLYFIQVLLISSLR